MAHSMPEAKTSIVAQKGAVRVHAFLAPPELLGNATYIVEGPEELVLIDGQLMVPYARQFRSYADSLGKKINRLYLSHDHADHFFGLGAGFDDLDIYALPESIRYIEEEGEALRAHSAEIYGDAVPKSLVVPRKIAQAGTVVIDSVTWEIVSFSEAETGEQLAFKLPDLGIYIVQDLIYSGSHLYITRYFDHWIDILKGFLESEYELFLPGHGGPADKKEIRANIEYLEKAREIFDTNPAPEEFKSAMLAAFPQRGGEGIIDIYLPRLFVT